MTSVDSTAGDSLGRSRGATETEETGGPVGLLYPAYGLVEALVGFGVFGMLVDQITPAAVAALTDTYPGLVGPVTTGAAVLLWLVAGAMAMAEAIEQARANPRTFPTAAERTAFLDANRPSEAHYRLNLVVMVLGGSMAVLAWNTVVDVLASAVPVVIDAGGTLPASLTLGNVAVFVVFVVAVAAYARALDRLVVGGAREFLYRTHTNDWA